MQSVTQILHSIQSGGPHTTDELFPLVYDQLRKLASSQMSRESRGQTLDATALVHEAFLRLVDSEIQTQWESRNHFFVAAAESMRRILVEKARQKKTLKRGGNLVRQVVDASQLADTQPSEEILALDKALEKLEVREPVKAELVKLRYFCGFSNVEACELLRISERSGERYWTYAKAWLYREIRSESSKNSPAE